MSVDRLRISPAFPSIESREQDVRINVRTQNLATYLLVKSKWLGFISRPRTQARCPNRVRLYQRVGSYSVADRHRRPSAAPAIFNIGEIWRLSLFTFNRRSPQGAGMLFPNFMSSTPQVKPQRPVRSSWLTKGRYFFKWWEAVSGAY